jgi:hypothetical protein
MEVCTVIVQSSYILISYILRISIRGHYFVYRTKLEQRLRFEIPEILHYFDLNLIGFSCILLHLWTA